MAQCNIDTLELNDELKKQAIADNPQLDPNIAIEMATMDARNKARSAQKELAGDMYQIQSVYYSRNASTHKARTRHKNYRVKITGVVQLGPNKYKVSHVTDKGKNGYAIVTRNGLTPDGVDSKITYSKEAMTKMLRKFNIDAVLYNNDGMTYEEIDEMFNSANTIDGTLENIQAEMQKADQEALGGEWDAEHSAQLKEVSMKLQEMSKEIAKLGIQVTTDKVQEIVEPIAMFDPTAEGAKIRIIRGSLGEEARNLFTMTNEEALVHETVHAALDWVFNSKIPTAGADLKLQIRDLYKYAQKVITFEDFLPEHEGVYTEAEIDKAKERYEYIFGTASNTYNQKLAGIRLQEFMAHLMTNKALMQALDKKAPEKIMKEKKANETILDVVTRWFWNTFQAMLGKAKKIKGDTLLEESTKLVYALTQVQDRYAGKATQRQGMPINEKIVGKIDEVLDTLDAKVSVPVNWAIDKMNGDDGKKGPKAGSKATEEEIKKLLSENAWLKKLSVSTDMIDRALYKSKAIQNMMYEAIKAKRGMETEKIIQKILNDLHKYEPKSTDNYFKSAIKAMGTIRTLKKLNKALKHTTGDEGLAIAQSKLLMDLGVGEGSFVHAVMSDFMAGRKTLVQITDMTMQFRSMVDRLRDHNFKGTVQDITEAFTKIDINALANKKYREALESAALSTDLQVVARSLGMKRTKELLSSDKAIDEEVNKIVDTEFKDLPTFQKHMYMRDILEAARYLVVGKGLRTNARNIALMYGHVWDVDRDGSEEVYVEAIDKLITLEALRMSRGRNELAELIDIDSDGVKFYLDTAKGMLEATAEEMQESGEYHDFVKGQARDKTHINRDMKYAPVYKRKEMEAQGYKLVRKLIEAYNDTDNVEYGVYVNVNAGIGKRVDGAASLQRRTVPGLLLSDKVRMSAPELDDKQMVKKFIKVRNEAIERYEDNSGYSEQDGDIELMQPVYNDRGFIIDFRYPIGKDDAIKYLELSVNGVEKLGRSFGQVGTMKLTNEQNRKLVDIVMDDSKDLDTSGEQFKDTQHLYIKIQPKELNLNEEDRRKLYESGYEDLKDEGKYGLKTEAEEYWALLPKDARDYIRQKNREMHGPDAEDRVLYVRKDLINQLFAYNEPSIMDIKRIGKTRIKVSKETERKIRVAEHYVKSFAQLLKSNVVVKMPSTIYGNIVSNAKFLVYSGMGPMEAMSKLWLSRKSLRQWKIDDKERLQAIRMMHSSEGKERDKYVKKLAEIEDRMAHNPLKPLMDAGMFQAIVEDIADIEDNNPITQAVTDQLDKVAGKNSLLHQAIQTAFLTNKSELGRFMVAVTQESDFHFRAALYWYGIEHGRESEEMRREVTDNFINYSKVINSKTIQYLDAIGPEAFYKYWSNIQRVEISRLRKNGFRVLMDISAQKLGLSPDAGIFHSNIFQTLGGRLSPIDSTMRLLDGGTTVPILNIFK